MAASVARREFLGFGVAALGAQHVGQFVARHQCFGIVSCPATAPELRRRACRGPPRRIRGRGRDRSAARFIRPRAKSGCCAPCAVFPNSDCLAVVAFRLQILALETARLGQVVERHGSQRMASGQIALRHFDGSPGVLFGARVDRPDPVPPRTGCSRRSPYSTPSAAFHACRAASFRHRHSGAA